MDSFQEWFIYDIMFWVTIGFMLLVVLIIMLVTIVMIKVDQHMVNKGYWSVPKSRGDSAFLWFHITMAATFFLLVITSILDSKPLLIIGTLVYCAISIYALILRFPTTTNKDTPQ
ncbi:hypothetical protein Peetri_00226 [Pseudomonas phage vB_PpuM-Peetri]